MLFTEVIGRIISAVQNKYMHCVGQNAVLNIIQSETYNYH